MIYFLVLLALIAVGLIWYTVLRETNLKKINAVAEEVAAGNRDRRISLTSRSGNDGRLAMNINCLIDELKQTAIRKDYLENLRIHLISDISHDLRTPLTSLLGYVEALKTDTKLTEEEKERYLEVIAAKGAALYSLLEGFFSLSKLEEEVIRADQQIEITEKIREVLVTLYQEFARENIVPSIEIPERPIFVLGDDGSIERVLQNLLSNSLRYGKDGGAIGIDLRETPEKVWVDVWDNGKGIPEKDIKYIFERLYTAEASRNEKLRGSGLGLAIAKKLVEKMNGEINLSSIPNVKTVFSFSLPKCKTDVSNHNLRNL